MRIVIVGCGRVGARLAGQLHREHDVTVIDQDQLAFRRLSPDFSGRMVQGNGIDVDMLREAGAAGADALIALTSGDNRNLTASQAALTILGVRRVIARVYDPVRADIFAGLGVETVSPTVSGAQRLFNQIVSG